MLSKIIRKSFIALICVSALAPCLSRAEDDPFDQKKAVDDPQEFSGAILHSPDNGGTLEISPLARIQPEMIDQVINKDFYWSDADHKELIEACAKEVNAAKITSAEDADILYRKIFWTTLAPKIKLRSTTAKAAPQSADPSEELAAMLIEAYKKQVKYTDFKNDYSGYCEKNNYLGIASILESRRFVTLCGLGCLLHEREGVSNDGWVKITYERGLNALKKSSGEQVADDVFFHRLQQRIDGQKEIKDNK